MAGVNQKRENLPGELVTPIRENADIPHNDGPEHQHRKIQDGHPSNPSVDWKPEDDEDKDSEEESESDSE